MKLSCALTEAGGKCNEDAFGYIGNKDDITAAWVIDGVTGINPKNLLPSATDARWFVERVQVHLPEVLAKQLPLIEALQNLVARLTSDWLDVSETVTLPADYDLPACCLLLVQKTTAGWQGLRLGDSFLLSRAVELKHHEAPASNLSSLEQFLKSEARKRRAAGHADFKDLLTEFRPQLLENRRSRNQPEGYSILEPTERALALPQHIDVGNPSEILLCTDGFYRCVDHYGLHDDTSVLAECENQRGAEVLLETMRKLEQDDPDCTRFLRFKPQDDATVLKLSA